MLGDLGSATLQQHQGRASLSPALPSPSLRVERRLRHLTDVLFPASPSFSRQHQSPSVPHCTQQPRHSTSRRANPTLPSWQGMLQEGSSMPRGSCPLPRFSRDHWKQEELLVKQTILASEPHSKPHHPKPVQAVMGPGKQHEGETLQLTYPHG